MLIKKCSYRNIEYEIHFTGDKDSDWGTDINKFYAKSEHNLGIEYFKTYEECNKDFKNKIDKIHTNKPKNMKELLDNLEECLVWTGYEDCHLDRKMAEFYIKTFKLSGEIKS